MHMGTPRQSRCFCVVGRATRTLNRSSLAGTTEQAFGVANQGSQRGVDGLAVAEVSGHIGRKEDEIRTSAIALEVFAADAARQFGEVILLAQFVDFFRLRLAFFIVFLSSFVV